MYCWSVNNWIIYYHQCSTIGLHLVSSTGKFFKPSFRTNLYRKKSMTISAVNVWNKIQAPFGDVILKALTTIKVKTLQTKKCIDKYWQYLSLMGRLYQVFIIITVIVVAVVTIFIISNLSIIINISSSSSSSSTSTSNLSM